MLFRMTFAATLLLCVVILDSHVSLLSFTLLCMMLLYAAGEQLILFVRSIKLLMWLFVPIVAFHGLFAPGIYTYRDLNLPVSIEGVAQGFLLCSSMSAMFFAALLVSRLLTSYEWLFALKKTPWLMKKMLPYLILLPRLKEAVSLQLQLQKQIWLDQGKRWLELPDLFVQGIESVVTVGKREAHDLWQGWDERVLIVNQWGAGKLSVTKLDMAYGMLTIAVWYLLWIR